MLGYVLICLWLGRSVPTKDEVLVPESLLKKRKSQEKARAERSAEADKKKKVGIFSLGDCGRQNDAQHILRLDLVNAVA